MDVIVQGILLGGLYASVAIGLSLVFGTMRLVNLAHGDFLIVGGYLTSILVISTGGDAIAVALPVAVVIGLLAYPVQRYILTPVMAQGDEAPITATFGIALLVETLLVLFFSSNPRSINSSYATAQVEIFGLHLRLTLLIATAFAVVLVIFLGYLFKKTSFGRQVRAAAADPEAAGLVGIDVRKTYARVMAIAAATASLGGVLIALSFSLAPAAATGWLLRAFTVVVIGGLGSLTGTLFGGFIVGLVETIGAVTIGPQYRDLVVFGVLVIVLLIRPNGLFVREVKAR